MPITPMRQRASTRLSWQHFGDVGSNPSPRDLLIERMLRRRRHVSLEAQARHHDRLKSKNGSHRTVTRKAGEEGLSWSLSAAEWWVRAFASAKLLDQETEDLLMSCMSDEDDAEDEGQVGAGEGSGTTLARLRESIRRQDANPRRLLYTVSHPWREAWHPRDQRSICCNPMGAPSWSWQDKHFGLGTHGMDYRYGIIIAGKDVLTETQCPKWQGDPVIEPETYPGMAGLAASAEGQAEIHAAVVHRTRNLVMDNPWAGRPFSDRVVTVWPDGRRIVTDLRGEPATDTNYDD